MTRDRIKTATGPLRFEAARFIAAHFAEHFGASVHDDTEELYVVESEDGEIQAAFGLNRNQDSFFCRRYLSHAGASITGAQDSPGISATGLRTIELAHLCVRRPATLCKIIGDLAEFLCAQGDQLICTVTGQLARYFEKVGLAPVMLARARAADLDGVERAQWGRYYESDPVVITGNLHDAMDLLGQRQLLRAALLHA